MFRRIILALVAAATIVIGSFAFSASANAATGCDPVYVNECVAPNSDTYYDPYANNNVDLYANPYVDPYTGTQMLPMGPAYGATTYDTYNTYNTYDTYYSTVQDLNAVAPWVLIYVQWAVIVALIVALLVTMFKLAVRDLPAK